LNDMPHAARTEAMALRYGREAIPADGPWNEALALLFAHRSVRAYLPDALPAGTTETLVAAAQSAATSSNMQSWSVVAVTDPARKARLAALASNQKHIEQAPLLLMFIADLSRHARLGAREGWALEGLPSLEAFLVAAIDCGIAAQNAVLAAEAIGLSTVYLGAMRNEPEAVGAELGLPPQSAIMFGLSVGYADPARPAGVKPRLPQSVVLHYEQYSAVGEAEGIARYDRTLHSFASRHEAGGYTWSERVSQRLGRLAQLAGRDKLRGALARLGFPLS
jgi:nitroreductase